MADIKVGIVGATGYTGSELLRILSRHPEVNVDVVTSESRAGEKITDVHPQFYDLNDLKLESIDDLDKHKLDVVFLALPHRVSMKFVKEKGVKKYKIIDLSGDFRLNKVDVYNKWYKTEHVAPSYLSKAAYGMPELFRNDIRKARLVANPGCYPTSTILPLAPLLLNNVIKPKSIIADAKSGMTGAGAKPKAQTHFPDMFGNFMAYGLHNHRHTPEIEMLLKKYSKQTVQVLFQPHLLPVDRGILTTTYSAPAKPVNTELLSDYYDTFYKKEHFVRLVDEPPSIKNVRGSNYADIFVSYDERTNRVITVSAIDNLVKGAAGQAVQNMNIMMNLIERTGLKSYPVSP